MTRKVGDKVKVNGSIQEIENITQWDKDTQRYKFVGVSGWHEIKEELEERKWSFWKKREERTKIIERSNVIQYDDMGYPLRLCIMSDNTQAWIDTNERDGDIVLRWKELEE